MGGGHLLRRSPCRNQLLHTALLALADQSLSFARKPGASVRFSPFADIRPRRMKSMIFATPGLRGLCGFDKVTQRAGRGCSSACAPFGFQREQIIFEGLQDLSANWYTENRRAFLPVLAGADNSWRSVGYLRHTKTVR